MLTPYADPVAVCWTCGLAGIHGTVDECLRDLRRAVAQAERDWHATEQMVQRLRAAELTKAR